MHSILNKLEIRAIGDRLPLRYYEGMCSVKIPPMYKIFLNTYYWKEPEKHFFHYPHLDIGEIQIHWDLIDILRGSIVFDESSSELRMLNIASSSNHKIILGLKGNYTDKIYIAPIERNGSDNDSCVQKQFSLIADNIFEFCKDIIAYDSQDDLLKIEKGFV